MAASDRPGGLTTLAVFNFLWGAVDLFSCLAQIAALVGYMHDPANHPAYKPEIVTTEQVQVYLGVGSGWAFMSSALLILSGIGYLGQKRMLGRWIGNTYGVLGACAHGFLLSYWPAELGGVSLEVFVSIFYPLFTLVLLNLVFRRDLTR